MARSGGDALKLRESRRGTLHGNNEKPSRLRDLCDARSDSRVKRKLDKYGARNIAWIDNIPSCPVFSPTKDEFEDPLKYLQSIAPEASKYGICKIVSPVSATVPAGVVLTREQPNFQFTTRVQPLRLSNWDSEDKITFRMSGKNYFLHEYEEMANKFFARRFSSAASLPARLIEAEFWKELTGGRISSVEYACDIEGSAFSTSKADAFSQSKWNLKEISQLPKSTLRLLDSGIPGVTEPMLYMGMLFSMFAWHVEDHYLYSINYHHFGAPKTWYGVPGYAAQSFEKVVQEHVYDSKMLNDMGEGAAYDLLIGKTTMFPAKLLVEHGVPVFRAVQSPGEFVITFPRAYHAGFSHGFNCGEAVNFAMADWFPFGAAACERYELLNRMPLLPHDELICKEAVCMAKREESNKNAELESGDLIYQRHVKAAFVSLIRAEEKALCLLKQKGGQVRDSLPFGSILCTLCKHACHIAYVTCGCSSEPMCLNHGEEMQGCQCGGSERLVTVRNNLPVLQQMAQRFKSDEVENSTEKVPSNSNNLSNSDLPLRDAISELNIPKREGSNALNYNRMEDPNQTLVDRVPVIADRNPSSILKRKNSCVVFESLQSESGRTIDGDGENDDSDEKSLQVKRRRVFVVGKSEESNKEEEEEKEEEHEQCEVKMEISLISQKPLIISEGGNSTPARFQTGWGNYAVLIRDIMHVLDTKGSVLEAVSEWQSKACNRAFALTSQRFIINDKHHLAMSLKGFNCLKRILPAREEVKLKNLIDQATLKPNPSTQMCWDPLIEGNRSENTCDSKDDEIVGENAKGETTIIPHFTNIEDKDFANTFIAPEEVDINSDESGIQPPATLSNQSKPETND